MSRFSNLATRYFMLVRRRPGTNAPNITDERIVGVKPKTRLAAAAALLR